MKKLISLILAVMMAASLASVAAAEDETVYGLMQIPYGDFYAAEVTTAEVDAVSSATDSKWASDTLCAGTFNAAHDGDKGGDILGVVYPVAITAADLSALGDENFAFTVLDEAPAAYKIVTVEDGRAVFSAIQGETTAYDAKLKFSSDSKYGDYQFDIDAINNADGTSDIGTIKGALITTAEGKVYGLRHLENIWKDKLAFSVGVKTEESHGNTLKYENYADLMGATVSAITYITDTGCYVIAADQYLPLKFVGGVEAESVAADAGKAAVSFTNLPDDFAPVYSVKGLDIAVADGQMTWEKALPGAYTLTVDDENGVYAYIYTGFVLSTDALGVAYDAEENALAAAAGYGEEMLNAFLANLSTVTVNGVEYAASGKGAVVIINEIGEMDTDAVLVKGKGSDAVQTPIFPESGEYEITVQATGFNTPLTFTVNVDK